MAPINDPRPRFLLTALVGLALLIPGVASAQRMTFLHTPPPSAEAGKDLEIVGNVFGAGDLAKARCRYREKGASWKQVELALEYGDLFRAIIPGQDVVPPSIEYYCIAIDYFGGQTGLYGSQSAPRRVRVTGTYRPRRSAAPTEPPPDDGAKKTEPGPKSDPTTVAPTEPTKPLETQRPAPAPEPAPYEAARADELALFGAEDVVTLATRQAQSVSVAPAIATGVPEDQMRALGLRTLLDVLKTVPGFETSRDVQGFHRVAARGMRDDSALLILYDGHRLNSPYDAKALLNLPTANFERVEVIRGPGSALYGTGAFLGVVNVVSKRREGLEAAVSGGSFGSAAAHLSAGLRLGESDWFIFGDADYTRTDGYRKPIVSDSLSTKMESAGLKDEEAIVGLTNDAGQLINVGAEIRRSPAGGAQTKLSARFLHEDRAALVGLFDVLGRESNLLWSVILADLSHEQPLGSSGALTVRGFFDQQMVDRLFQVAPRGYQLAADVSAPVGLFERTRYTAMTYGGELGLDLSIAQSHRLSLGLSGAFQDLPKYTYQVNWEQEEVFADLREPTGFTARQSMRELNRRLVAGAFVQDVWRVHETLSLTLGLRADVTQLPKTSESGGEVLIQGTRMVPSLNPRLGLVWSPGEGWNFKLLYGRAFRAPTMQELAERIPTTDLSQGRFEGDPGLKPATIDTVEAGVETATAVGENKVRLRANGFFNNFTDPIMAIDTSGNIIPLSNRKLGVRVWGAEAEVRFEISSRAYTFINYSWFRAIDLAAPEGFQYLVDVPQYRFNWAAQLPLGRHFDLAVLTQLGAERRNNARSQLETMRYYRIPAYALVGAQLRTEQIAEHFDFALTVQNLFQYELYDDVPRPDKGRMPGLLPREGLGAYLTARMRL
ncbi:MAG: TonB-dependent receptor plug domain-containing protein [Myxococcales bacterium]|jgi:outer membrane receptor protein involved in Fe transport